MSQTPTTYIEEKLAQFQQQMAETNTKRLEVSVMIVVARTELDDCGDPIRATELRAAILEHGKTLSNLQGLSMSLNLSIHETRTWLGEQMYQMGHDQLLTIERTINEHQSRLSTTQKEHARICGDYQEKLKSWPNQVQRLLQEHPAH